MSAPTGGAGPPRSIECAWCGEGFAEDRGQPTCRSCPLADACRYVRCPRCGYENPVSPGWMRRLLVRRSDGDAGGRR